MVGTGSSPVTVVEWTLTVGAGILLPGLAVVRAGRRRAAPLVVDVAWAAPTGCVVALLG